MLLHCGPDSFNLFEFDGLHFCIANSQFILHYYGILLMLGAIAGAWLASVELKRRGHDPEMVWDLLIWLIIGGVIGARLWHVFTPTAAVLVSDPATGKMVNPYFVGGYPHILDILEIWKGGLGIPGTIIGGAIALYFYTRSNKAVSFFEWADIAAPGLALGQAIGRWGNYFNQELYGSPTTLPWGIKITNAAARVAPYNDLNQYPLDVTRFHPLFLYESILNLANMLLLLWLTRRYAKKLKLGDIFLVYLIAYPTIRFFLEFIRVDYPTFGTIDPNQVVVAVVAVLAAVILIWRHRTGTNEPTEVEADSESRSSLAAVEVAAEAPVEASKPARKSSSSAAAKKSRTTATSTSKGKKSTTRSTSPRKKSSADSSKKK
jgi:phosphatidylglycerol:prolipoprotein diacylglycerol transferase